MSNIAKAFANGKAFIPFITCGDPDLATTAAAVRAMAANGADLIELGIPVVMAVNMIVSSAALIRYDARLEGVAAQTSLDTLLDEHFDDSYMQRVYPKLVHMN